MTKRIQGMLMAILVAAGVLAATMPAAAKPGPVVLTFMERIEKQSDAYSSTTSGSINVETYMYTMVSAFRKLDKNVTGNVYYLNKYSVDDRDKASDIYGLNIARTLTPRWKADVSYSHSSNPMRNTVRSSDSDRFSFGFTFKLNPKEKVRKRYTFKTTYSTGSDFSAGRTLSQKITVNDSITKNWSYALGYSFVWGLNESPPNTYKEHYTNQYQLDFTYKISKKQRVTLGYLYLDQMFHAARNSGDNSLMRMSYFYSHY